MLYHSCNILDVSFHHGISLMQLNLPLGGDAPGKFLGHLFFLITKRNVPFMARSVPGSQADRLTRYPVFQTDRDGLSPVNLSDRGDDTEAIGQENRFLRRKAGRAKELVSNTQQKQRPSRLIP